MMNDTTTPWIKAAASADNGSCVEMRRHEGAFQVRDSKNPDGPVLTFTRAEVEAFVTGAGAGDFNQLLDN